MKKNLTNLLYSKPNKPFKTKYLESEHTVKEIENIETEYKPYTSNISNEKQNALKDLMNNLDIILK